MPVGAVCLSFFSIPMGVAEGQRDDTHSLRAHWAMLGPASIPIFVLCFSTMQ